MPGVVPSIYRVPKGNTREREGGEEREGGDAPMANTQTDEFIKTVTANRAQLAKAGYYKEVWFYERREREGETESVSEGGRGVWSDWLGGKGGGG